jgi:hypothetical protein
MASTRNVFVVAQPERRSAKNANEKPMAVLNFISIPKEYRPILSSAVPNTSLCGEFASRRASGFKRGRFLSIYWREALCTGNGISRKEREISHGHIEHIQ